jgi:sec-independent protein translocase protein TatC
MKPLDASMSFGDHLEELRRRLIIALLGPLPIFIIALFFGGPLLEFLLAPAEAALHDAGLPAKLLATSPAEPFIAYLKVAFVVALLFSAPWILYQAWLFVAPGLYASEKRFAHILFPLSGVLTAAGLTFLYTVLLPVMLRFLIAFGIALASQPAPDAPAPAPVDLPGLPILPADPPLPEPGQMWINESTYELRIAMAPSDTGAAAFVMAIPMTAAGAAITQQYRVSEYVSLCFNLGVVFTLAFQLPVVMLLGGWVGILDPRELAPYRRHALFGCAVVSALATPADPLSMILLMVPLYLLFEFGLILMRLAPGDHPTDAAQGDA